ncbi:probable ATP-dependent DNA helicase CHR12 [Coffea eugenioides]|uniref:probable ATP-dependent DNA helicase CHR12 n=1 Tax=Coffea eugenioides TaxID=49369 RepID=UPI000F5CB4BE|nr:probable ATP-dependent DNA helicase CHR12 [Coffea arabica]XP_027164831.1 probable ATP-dependent DNA helicase CHR12 [Coffea eugenioides]
MAAQVETTSQPGGGAGGSAGNPSEIHTDVNSGDNASGEEIEKTRTLICALNFLSRNLPLPQDVFDAVSSIYHDGTTADTAADEENNHVDDDKNEEEEATERGADNQNDDANVVGGGGVGSSAVAAERAAAKDRAGMSSYGDLMADFEVAVLKQRENCMSGSGLGELKESHFQSHIHRRLTELEELPASRGEDLQTKCLLELYGLKLVELQNKVRSEVSAEYWLRLHCTSPENQLFDWGMMRLRRPLYGIGDAFAVDTEDPLKKKRDAERLSRLEEEERNHVETRKRKFFADLLNAVRELQLQVQASQKRRKQRNDGVQAWHAKQRQRATRAEKLRFQALKADDQEAYMKMVEESKNERLTMLLGKTNDLLVRLGAAVQRQKDAELQGIEPLEGSDADLPELSASKTETPGQSRPLEDEDVLDNETNSPKKGGDLLEGQRQYNSVVHSIEEKVTEQPAMLQGGELRQYQLEGLQWMLSLFNNNLNGILADEMGLGKTIQTISLIVYLMENKGVTGPHLIVAPKAVLPNWINEFATWAPSVVAVLYDGRADERKAIKEEFFIEGKFNVLITHYDLVIRDKKVLNKIQWNYLIVDEGHRLKNHDCVLSRTIVTGYNIRRRLLLTGTPIQNSLQELWSLLNFLLPNIFNSVENFEEWFNAPFADRGNVTLTDEEELLVIRRLHHVIRPFILRRKKDEVEKFLPGKIQVILKCDMSAWQRVYYQQVTDVGRVGLDNGTGKSKSLQNLSMQLRKCCNHPYLFVAEYNMWRKEEVFRASGKFELLDRLLPKLHKSGHRVLLFSQMTRLMDILEIYLQLHDFKYLRLDGSTKTEERGSLLRQFNAPDSPYFMFLLSTRAGGLGLNLQTADTVIIFDSDWNPQMDQQAEDRAHRIGQKKEVRVFVLVSVGSIEEVILERAKQKMGIDAKVIQAGLFNTTSTAQDRREMLEEIMRKGTSSLGADVPSEREINRLAARSDEEFWLFEKMDEDRRRKESYRSRLMEEHEVPDWAYAAPETKERKGKGFQYEAANITGKRRRKEVVYADTYGELEWTKAVENGDLAKHSDKGKKRRLDNPTLNNDLPNNSAGGEKRLPVLKNETVAVAAEITRTSSGSTSIPKRLKYEDANSSKIDHSDRKEGSLDGLTWKAHQKKRSSLV